MRYTPNTSCNSSKIHFSETKHIRRQTHSISSEKLSFRDGAFLGDLDLSSESGNTRRKVRTGMNMPGHSAAMRALAKHGGGVL